MRNIKLTESERETYLLKLLLNLYHNEVDAHYNVEQFLKSEYECKFAIPEEKEVA